MEEFTANPSKRRCISRTRNRELKNSTGKISVESGVRTWQLFIQHDLFDDLWILVHPVVVSQGEKLFAHAKKQFSLNLNSSKTYKNGVVGLYYQK